MEAAAKVQRQMVRLRGRSYVAFVFTSMMLILHPRIGGPPTAAVLANSAWGLIGLGIAIAVLHVAALQFGSAIGLSLALATCVGWNLSLWWLGRRKAART